MSAVDVAPPQAAKPLMARPRESVSSSQMRKAPRFNALIERDIVTGPAKSDCLKLHPIAR